MTSENVLQEEGVTAKDYVNKKDIQFLITDVD